MKKFINYYFILLLILTSGAIFFTFLYGKIFTFVLFFSAVALLIVNRKVSKKNLTVASIISLIMILNYLFNLRNGLSIVVLVGIIVRVISIGIISSSIKIDEFKKCYINILFVLSAMSLPLFYTLQVFPSVRFPFMQSGMIQSAHFIYAPYHTWGWTDVFSRNAGVFWEPGAFQAFINLALIMLLMDYDLKKILSREYRKNNIFIIIFIITILSTKSTTGYIICLLAVLYKLFQIFYKRFNKKTLIIITAIVIVFVGILITNSKVISGKFSNNNISYNIRKQDIIGSMKMIIEKPITGFGYLSNEGAKKAISYGNISNSNGMLTFFYMFGIPAGIAYFIAYYYGIKNLTNNNIFDTLFLLAVMAIMFSSEDIMMKPLFLSYLFYWGGADYIKMRRGERNAWI